MAGVVYALDFDGVLCDSCDESSVSGVRAAVDLWPLEMGGVGVDVTNIAGWLLRGMRIARPAIHTGWENVVIARALHEAGESACESLATSFTTTTSGWEGVRDTWVSSWGTDKEALVGAFAGARDKWILEDREGWVSANRFYPGVITALNFSTADIYIVTTKQRRFVDILLSASDLKRGVIPGERIYSYGCGSKISTLKKIIAMESSKGKIIEFVEDRYETLEAASLSLLASPVKFYLATHGYNTQERKIEASAHPLISCIDLDTFVKKLQ